MCCSSYDTGPFDIFANISFLPIHLCAIVWGNGYLPHRGGGIWKIKKKGWKDGAGAGLLKRLTLFVFNFFKVYHFYI